MSRVRQGSDKPKRELPDDRTELKPADDRRDEREEHSYYYDDAYGYEDFDPDSDVPDEGEES